MVEQWPPVATGNQHNTKDSLDMWAEKSKEELRGSVLPQFKLHKLLDIKLYMQLYEHQLSLLHSF